MPKSSELTLKLLLGPEVVAVSTLLLATIHSTRVKTSITPKEKGKGTLQLEHLL